MAERPTSPAAPPGSTGQLETAGPVIRSAELRLGGRLLPLISPARLYVCGITPYDVTHLGHAATFVWADVAAAVLRMAGVEVVTCRNVTDVDDVLTHAADARGRAYDEFALYQEYLFDKDMTALRMHRPAHEPRARHHVGQVQQLAAALLATGHAYQREGHVYFRGGGIVERAGLTTDEALARSAEYGDDPQDPLRDDPFDVPVWRPSTGGGPGAASDPSGAREAVQRPRPGDPGAASDPSGAREAVQRPRPGDPAWPSPWGPGRPGWHAECAAMALALLGTGVDLLAGGADLAFPHHVYQAAMAEAATSVAPFARGLLHVGTVYQGGAKMAKSTGNLTLVGDLLRDHSPAAVRLLVLRRPWHESWSYQPEGLEAAAGELEELYAAAGRPDPAPAAATAVTAALLDDLDVPRALAIAREEGGEAARLLLHVLSLA